MELCAKCPMRDERYTPTDVSMKMEISQLRLALEEQRDFIEFLFDHSEHCDHISYSDAWDEFTEWQNKSSAELQNPEVSDTTGDAILTNDDQQKKQFNETD